MSAPEWIGKYRPVRRLGKGGMGIVYKAHVPVIDKVVALKVLAPSEAMEITVGGDDLERIFLAEARTLANLNHQNLAAVWDFDRDQQGRPFFVMEYYCNNLGDMIGEQFRVEEPSRPIRPEKVLHYGSQILDALEYLHENSIVHRDIKPFNILITDRDLVKICDFGMALVDGVSFSGPANMQIGSPFYTPPEQQRAPQTVDNRADCFSTAVLLYRMLTGTLPGMQSFPLSMINPLYDRNWDQFFQKGLNWDPAQRFQSSTAMKAALQALQLNPVAPSRNAPVKRSARPRQLRSEAGNHCGRRALERFGLGPLQRPLSYVQNDFKALDDIVFDRATGLTWQRAGSPFPRNWENARAYIDSLNDAGFAGLSSWRLPTIEELLSLLDEPTGQPHPSIFASDRKWLWSCDRHGKKERWFINLDMGYVASQDEDCLNFIRGVSSEPPGKWASAARH